MQILQGNSFAPGVSTTSPFCGKSCKEPHISLVFCLFSSYGAIINQKHSPVNIKFTVLQSFCYLFAETCNYLHFSLFCTSGTARNCSYFTSDIYTLLQAGFTVPYPEPISVCCFVPSRRKGRRSPNSHTHLACGCRMQVIYSMKGNLLYGYSGVNRISTM